MTLVSHSDQRLRVKVNLYDEYLSTRCKMTNPDDPKAGASVIFEHNGESHDFVAQGCKASGVARAQNEFIVDDLDGKQTVFKSDSAFYIY